MSVPIPDRQALDAAFDAQVGRLFEVYCTAVASVASAPEGDANEEHVRSARKRYDAGYKIAWDAHEALSGT